MDAKVAHEVVVAYYAGLRQDAMRQMQRQGFVNSGVLGELAMLVRDRRVA